MGKWMLVPVFVAGLLLGLSLADYRRVMVDAEWLAASAQQRLTRCQSVVRVGHAQGPEIDRQRVQWSVVDGEVFYVR